jgi:hypothetical protein
MESATFLEVFEKLSLNAYLASMILITLYHTNLVSHYRGP